MLRTLMELDWIDPTLISEFLTVDPTAAEPGEPVEVGGVRSLAEDLAVARLRAATASQRSREAVLRAQRVVARSEQLATDARRRREDARSTRESARDRIVALELQVDQLKAALETRPRIEHAIGMVMLELGCDEQVAWKALSRVSQKDNFKLRYLAENLTGQVADAQGIPEHLLDALLEGRGLPED